ncbi:PhnD/SsuA/transferrin family substrate-binding protein [Bradyrhizobium sp. Arg237L]|uniref:phosphate/phosphite/phosphonate ABC transporter substrate-binding protein n=1 Tax=Bradyrhizobium sp. Arg237L TaxID=3003352 RepID=UPI00249EB5E4|nr:PhnD/SsuA/transferrin family substrate-binding protein [Bradyrhizobium sp. Arg237L]MDI4234096.1 PhnD/SsuA/transferrin family substrate-binding protein [Bradyrhizobium sp. Arg237L]
MTRTASLPMYALPEMEVANSAFLAALQRRLRVKGVDTTEIRLDSNRVVSDEGIGPDVFFTQVCGYPLFKHYRDRGLILATPHYAFPGCVGSTHRAFFIVRAGDPAQRLEHLRGRVFGCNSLLSNSGMNLPRLSLARIAGGKPFFSSVVITGGHVASLERLDRGSIDICSIDSVTWGFFEKFRPDAAERYRIIDETVSSPSLPFVTSVKTAASDAVALAEALQEILNDPQIADIRGTLELTGLSVPDAAGYERLAEYEREAAELGFPEIR